LRMLVTFALKAEFSPWSSHHSFVPYEFENWERRREFDLFKANIGRNEVTVLLTGIGGAHAAKAMSSVPLNQYDICISSGLAGALDSSLKPGAVVAARVAQTAQQDSQEASDPVLLDLACSCGARTVDVSLSCEHIVATVDEKEGLRESGEVVEMESAHILASARASRVPAVVVRAISDAADEDLPVDFQRILDSHGHLKIGGLLKEVGLSPYRIPLLIQFCRQSRAAARSLADFLDRYIAAVSEDYAKLAQAGMEEVSAT
jgi:adenosylhomocysteine nucleosidase